MGRMCQKMNAFSARSVMSKTAQMVPITSASKHNTPDWLVDSVHGAIVKHAPMGFAIALRLQWQLAKDLVFAPSHLHPDSGILLLYHIIPDLSTHFWEIPNHF